MLRLKSLDIQGFKSFPDRTKLDFDLGVTAVVGPNGSGKSNIADAVRWVLGEQSTRTLRGGKMEDVIFGGTQTRKAQGVASVTLTVDNTDRCLGLDADEVAVTRRLYRTGDSEYRINGAMVRLRDINELLMDTGLGRDGYSIIGQGRVAEIVSARSKERREIFEEAAGITKFRYRKTEAERQLAMAEENLVRLRDILEELASRVGPLKEQSSKAQKFLDFSAEKKILEVSIWMHTLREAGQRAAALEDQFLLTQRDYDEASDAVTAQETAFSDEQERGHVLMAEIETLRTEAERLSDQLRDWGSQTAVLQNDIGHHRRAIEEAKGAIAQAGRSREETEAEIKAKIQNKALQQKDIVEARTAQEALTRQVSVLDAEGVGRAEALDALRMRRTGVFEAIEAARMDAASASTLLTDSISRLETMQRAVNECAQVVSQLETEGVSCSELRTQLDESLIEMDNAAKGYLLKRDSRRQKLDALTAEDDVLAKRIHEKRQRATLLTELEKNMEGFAPSIKYVMKQSKVGALPGVRGPVSSLLHVKSEHTLAIETALGGALQNIVVENEETAKRAIRQLDAARTGRATFLPMTSVSGRAMDARDLVGRRGFVGVASELVEADDAYVGIVLSLLGRIAVMEDLDCAVETAKRSGYRFRIVTLDGQVINAGGSMTGGYAAKSAGLLSRKREIESLLAQAKELNDQREALTKRRESAAWELSTVATELEVVEAQRKTLCEDRIRCESEATRVAKGLIQARRQAEDARHEQRALHSRIEEMQKKSGSAGEMVKQLSEELETLQMQIAWDTTEERVQATRKSELIAQMTAQNTKILLLERDIAATEQETLRLSMLIGTNEQQREDLAGRITALEHEISDAEADILKLKESAVAAHTASDDYQLRAQQAIVMRNECERHMTQLRAGERELSGRRDAIYRELVRLGEQKKAGDVEVATLVAKLYDEYELTRSAAEEIACPIQNLTADNRRLAELRGKLKALGPVNVGAITEYSEVSLRYETMLRQLTDVERSKTELTRMIGQLTAEMCSIFETKFEQINQHFGKVFTDLFEGGSASLTLSVPDDLLESGIEITVRPPGKIIKNLAALSGGEQAFVAIAIFFAILKVNPAPFCLMDEIEAALDDVNVSRFAAYLRTMTDRTQFIVITHRRGTMEGADVLYGVTMQEEGVSKLLELKISELEKSVVV